MRRITVLSHNIHKGKSALGVRSTLTHLSRHLRQMKPDLVFLQEVQGRNELNSRLDGQHDTLSSRLNMQAVYGLNSQHAQTDHGNVLLSRFPVLQAENQDISDHRLEQRGLLHVLIEIDGCSVHCFVVHLGLFKQSRERQLTAIIERIKRLVKSDEPLIIAGDFNDWNEKLATHLMSSLGICDVFEECVMRHDDELPKISFSPMRMYEQWNKGDLVQSFEKSRILESLKALVTKPQDSAPRTFPAIFPWLRLDRMYQRGFAVHSAQVLKGKPWTQISDHSPLLVELELLAKTRAQNTQTDNGDPLKKRTAVVKKAKFKHSDAA